MPLPRILSPYPPRRHRADSKQRRIARCANRWTATIGELGCQALLVVGSRYLDGGELPPLQLLTDRRRMRHFAAACNPEPAVD